MNEIDISSIYVTPSGTVMIDLHFYTKTVGGPHHFGTDVFTAAEYLEDWFIVLIRRYYNRQRVYWRWELADLAWSEVSHMFEIGRRQG